MKTIFVVIDVGCLECGEETTVLKVCRTRAKANELVTALAKERGEKIATHDNSCSFGYFTAGQHAVGVYLYPCDVSPAP